MRFNTATLLCVGTIVLAYLVGDSQSVSLRNKIRDTQSFQMRAETSASLIEMPVMPENKVEEFKIDMRTSKERKMTLMLKKIE